MKIFNYANLKRLKRGIRLYVFLSFKCNFDCPHCIAKIPDGKYPHCEKEKTVEEWIELISNFPVRVREIRITGGEPFENDVTVPLVKWAISEGYFVIIETNLSSNIAKLMHFKKLAQLPNTVRLQFYVTYHKGQINREVWLNNYLWLNYSRKKCTFIANSFVKKEFGFSVKKDWVEIESMKVPKFIIGPDHQIFRNCFEAYNAYKK